MINWDVKNFDLIINIEEHQKKNMTEENIGQIFRLKWINEKNNYFIEEIRQDELISKKRL